MVPEHLDGLDFDALVGTVDTAEGGAIGNHVHVGVFLADEAALEAGMDGSDYRFLAIHFLIDVDTHLEHAAVGVGGPAGIAVGVFHSAAGQAEGALELGGGGHLGALDGGALAGSNMNHSIFHFDGGQVGGGLDEVFNLAAHGQHAVGAGIEEVDEALLRFLVDEFLGHLFDVAQFELHIGLGAAELEYHGFAHLGDHGLEGAHLVFRHGDEGFGLAGDGVAQVAAVDGGETHTIFIGTLPEDAVEQLVGAGTTAVDVVAAVATHQTAYLDEKSLVALDGGHQLVVELGGGVDAAGAADAVLALVFVVEVEEDLALEPALAEAVGAGETRLLVHGDEGFECGMGDFLVLEDGEDGGDADAVVGTEGGAVGREPRTVQHWLDGVFHEVELLAAVLLADHVHVSLQAHAGALLVALAGGLADEHIAQLVALGLETVLLAPVHEVGRDALFVLRGARNLHDFTEPVPHALWFESF